MLADGQAAPDDPPAEEGLTHHPNHRHSHMRNGTGRKGPRSV